MNPFKTLLQGLILALLFAAVFMGLSQVDFIGFFHIEQIRETSEKKLGEVIWNDIRDSETVVDNDSVNCELEKILAPLFRENPIERDSIRIHLVKNEQVNAFALPGGHLVIYTGLIAACNKPEAFQGVAGHEIAHIEQNHVMKKLSKEIGLSVLLSAATGSNSGAAREVLHLLSSSAYDRSLEEEADRESVNYLLKAGIDPTPFADLMYQMAQEKDLPDAYFWISSHPESEARAHYILAYLKNRRVSARESVRPEIWKAFKKRVSQL